ncbi:hypothetical protein F4679DRAFT_73605, partial [Xylaria curta]
QFYNIFYRTSYKTSYNTFYKLLLTSNSKINTSTSHLVKMASQTNETFAAVDATADEWVTVTKKRTWNSSPPSPPSPPSRTSWNDPLPDLGPLRGRNIDVVEWLDNLTLPDDIAASIIARLVAGDDIINTTHRGKSQGGKKGGKKGGKRRGQHRQHQKSSEEEIQGPLPGWYKPPSWDVKPKRRDQKKAK